MPVTVKLDNNNNNKRRSPDLVQIGLLMTPLRLVKFTTFFNIINIVLQFDHRVTASWGSSHLSFQKRLFKSKYCSFFAMLVLPYFLSHQSSYSMDYSRAKMNILLFESHFGYWNVCFKGDNMHPSFSVHGTETFLILHKWTNHFDSVLLMFITELFNNISSTEEEHSNVQ